MNKTVFPENPYAAPAAVFLDGIFFRRCLHDEIADTLVATA